MPIDTTGRVAGWIAYATAAMTAVTFGVAVATPPISGSLCVQDCIDYPYLDTLERFPRDYLWMPLAIVLTLLYLALMASVHEFSPSRRRLASRIALARAIVTTTVLVTTYFVQLTVVPASLAHSQTDGIALLTQHNPHGLFIALEEVGYLTMAPSLLGPPPRPSLAGRPLRARSAGCSARHPSRCSPRCSGSWPIAAPTVATCSRSSPSRSSGSRC